MNFQEILNSKIKENRDKTFENNSQMSLGEIISKLENIIKDLEKPEEISVRYDFEYLFPTDIDSWRGNYNELALNFEQKGNPMNCIDFLKMLKEANGETFTGYKGGDYKMDLKTPVWVANYGHSGDTAVCNVLNKVYKVVLKTDYFDY